MRLRDTFATNLRLARDAAGLTQEELAHRAGTDRSYVSDLECSKYSATLDMVESLATGLGISWTELLAPRD